MVVTFSQLDRKLFRSKIMFYTFLHLMVPSSKWEIEHGLM